MPYRRADWTSGVFTAVRFTVASVTSRGEIRFGCSETEDTSTTTRFRYFGNFVLFDKAEHPRIIVPSVTQPWEPDTFKVRIYLREDSENRYFIKLDYDLRILNLIFAWTCINDINNIDKTCRQHRGCIIPQAVTSSLVLLKMGKIIARNMLSWLELLINRYCCM